MRPKIWFFLRSLSDNDSGQVISNGGGGGWMLSSLSFPSSIFLFTTPFSFVSIQSLPTLTHPLPLVHLIRTYFHLENQRHSDFFFHFVFFVFVIQILRHGEKKEIYYKHWHRRVIILPNRTNRLVIYVNFIIIWTNAVVHGQRQRSTRELFS